MKRPKELSDEAGAAQPAVGPGSATAGKDGSVREGSLR
jgi:hypothetical protein